MFGFSELCPWKHDTNIFQMLEALKMLALEQVEKNKEKCNGYIRLSGKGRKVMFTEICFRFFTCVLM